MDNWLAYICETRGTLDKVKPNLMNFITKVGFLIFLFVSATGIIMAQPCGSPENVYIETIGFNTINIDWDEIGGATYYEVEYENMETSNTETTTSNTSSIVVSNVTGGTYEIQITTYCDNGSVNVSLGVVVVIVDNLEDIETMCHTCYQKIKECEVKDGYENCNCAELCKDIECCNFVVNNIVLITPPIMQECDCKALCEKASCCDYIDGDTGAMPIICEECADAVRNCNKATKAKGNKTSILLEDIEACQIEAMYPNPFKNQLQISFELHYNATTSLTIYDNKGQEVSRVLNSKEQEEGTHQYHLNTNDWKTGIYYSVLETKEGCKTVQKMLKIE
ncbi:MAG: T9SS type A sorting domain-containing protein [Chitinophagales bacterium]